MPASFEILCELCQITTHGMKWDATPPTQKSLDHIHDVLGILIPNTYQQIAAQCPNYGAYLNGIGEDFSHHIHIIELNRIFHDPDQIEPPLPKHFVMLNHGHDGDCDCWDLREITADGEHPIVHVSLESAFGDEPSIVRVTSLRHECFLDYLEFMVVYCARPLAEREQPWFPSALRIRAAELIQKLSEDKQNGS